MREMNFINADLHTHTSLSAGVFTPEQLIAYALEKHLDKVAITDTFSVDGAERALKAARQESINVIPGLELITCEEGYELSFVGLFLDLEHPVLKSELPFLQQKRGGLTSAHAIKLITTSLGVAILANPVKSLNGLCKNETLLQEKLAVFKDMGLTGVEVYRPDHDPETTTLLEKISGELELVCSGGSDFYSPDDPGHQLGSAKIPKDAWDILYETALAQ